MALVMACIGIILIYAGHGPAKDLNITFGVISFIVGLGFLVIGLVTQAVNYLKL